MRSKINSYMAALLITIAGVAATLLIVRLNESNNFDRSTGYNAASYAELKESILHPQE